jgi:uncharacterized protein (DUF1810 family)
MAKPSDDPFRRFVQAQDAVWPRMIAELRPGCKQSHWMWFIFPQLEGLGHSRMARKFALSSLEEAQAFASHSLLGPRHREFTRLILDIERRKISEIFGHPDDLKFHSSMTLFMMAAPNEPIYREALDKYYGGAADALTLHKLGMGQRAR